MTREQRKIFRAFVNLLKYDKKFTRISALGDLPKKNEYFATNELVLVQLDDDLSFGIDGEIALGCGMYYFIEHAGNVETTYNKRVAERWLSERGYNLSI